MPLRFAVPLTCLLLPFLSGSALQAGETPDEILDRMETAASGGKALQMDYLLVQYRSGRRVDARGTARYHADGKRFVNELKTQAENIEVDVRMVCDGATVWTEVREGRTLRSVQKFSYETLSRLGGISVRDPKAQVRELRARYALATSRDGKLGEQAVKVLEGTLREDFVARQLEAAKAIGGEIAAELAKPQLETMTKARVYVEPASARILKTELLDKAGRIVLSFELSNIKTGVAFEDNISSYSPPAGAKVMDLDLSLPQGKRAKKEE